MIRRSAGGGALYKVRKSVTIDIDDLNPIESAALQDEIRNRVSPWRIFRPARGILLIGKICRRQLRGGVRTDLLDCLKQRSRGNAAHPIGNRVLLYQSAVQFHVDGLQSLIDADQSTRSKIGDDVGSALIAQFNGAKEAQRTGAVLCVG